MGSASNSHVLFMLLANIMKKHHIGKNNPQQKLARLVNAAEHRHTVSAVFCATMCMSNLVHYCATFDPDFYPLYAIVRFLLDPGHDGTSDWEGVHVDAAAKYRMRIRMSPGSDFLLRRFKDMHYMHTGSLVFYPYVANWHLLA
jgi:hypothetical protein